MSVPKFKTMGLTHIALSVKDLKKSVDFYQKIFGVEIMYEGENWAQVQTPGSNDIIVFEQKENYIGQQGGIQHFGFRLINPADIGLAAEVIVNAGGQIKERGEFVPGEPYIFFYDPDGYEIEVWYEISREL